MNKQLVYTVAGHPFVVETANPEVTAAALPNYAPFRVHPADEKYAEAVAGALFRFSGGRVINLPDVAPSDEMEQPGLFSKVFSADDYVFAVSTIGNRTHKMKADKNWSVIETDVPLDDASAAYFVKHFLTTAFGMAAAPFKTLKIHASCIKKGGKALVFLGESGTGKSTHSRLWQEFVPEVTLLNDDEPIVRVMHDGSVRVYGAPWSGSTPCYCNDSAEVAAFVHLFQHPENKLRQLSPLEAVSSLMLSASLLRSDSRNKQMVFGTLSDILNAVPVFRLDCRPDREAVGLTQTLM